MDRQTLSVDEISTIVRRSAGAFAACRYCHFGDIHVHEIDETGCNWSISQLQGHGCFECLEAVKLLIADLRSQYRVAEADDEGGGDFLTTWAFGPR